MNRIEFERIRDLPDKVIRGDIRFVGREPMRPFVVAEYPIDNTEGYVLRLMMRFNTIDASKTFNVHIPGVGPICRLDVDGHNHPPAGRQHKHALQNERCSGRNLPAAVARPDLTGKSMRECFAEFCAIASITHVGTFYPPDEDT